jgi:glutamate-1-semialdehyde 2,1-aminomutase
MRVEKTLLPRDEALVRRLQAFAPEEVFDIHAHLVTAAANLGPHLAHERLGLVEYSRAIGQLLPGRKIHSLLFGFPSRASDRAAINDWMRQQLDGRPPDVTSRGLLLAGPEDDPASVHRQLQHGVFVGLKPYHLFAPLADTRQARIEDFAPEWMWEACAAHDGVLMLHIMKDASIADHDNLETIRRLCSKYSRCRLVLAHVARSFSHRSAREGLRRLADVENLCVDTSAVTEAETFRIALETLGSRRVLFGSDYPVSHLRGRCGATGDYFTWHYSDGEAPEDRMTLVGIESLLCLQDAAIDCGLDQTDLDAIFLGNAQRLLAAHLDRAQSEPSASGPELWSRAKRVISGGTGLRSKWAEMFDPRSWPSYYSRCAGSNIWDAAGRQYTDFGAGAGAVLLGYADADVNAAVKKRVDSGSYCQLASPQEPELAELLLSLHPWAGKVRFARGGGDAMAVAVMIARAATGKSGIAFCGYHGWHDWYLSANLSEESALDGHLLPGLAPLGVPRELAGTSVPFRFNDVASFETALQRLGDRLGAVVMEPMRTQFPADGFLEHIKARCQRLGVVLVFDEITSGWRFGFPGAHAKLGVQPDIVAYAKAMSNGYPCAAVIGRDGIMDSANPSFISSSYWTDGVGPAASLASIRKMQRLDVQNHVWQAGERFQRELSKIVPRHPSCRLRVSGMPANPYLSFELGENALAAKTLLVRELVTRGVLSTGSASFIMLTHTPAMLDRYVEAIDESLAGIAPLVESGRLAEVAAAPNAMGSFARLT